MLSDVNTFKNNTKSAILDRYSLLSLGHQETTRQAPISHPRAVFVSLVEGITKTKAFISKFPIQKNKIYFDQLIFQCAFLRGIVR